MINWSETARWLASTSVIGAVVVIAAPAPAGGQSAALIESVKVEGEAAVGSTLAATVVTTDPTAVIEYRWQRCSGDGVKSCDRIKKALNAPTYTIAASDVGSRVAVRALTTVGGVSDAMFSSLTRVVPDPTPQPTPTPTPTPTPDPTPPPDPGGDEDPDFDPHDDPPTFNQSGGRAPVTGPAIPAAPSGGRPAYLRPFPVVRVKGTLVNGGARISLLRVKAPSLATVAVRCKGPGCHLRRRYFGSGRIRALERFLRVGARITIRVSGPNSIGKYARLVIRDGSAPKRRDACLLPGDNAPAECPAA
jgi:hypothetical protein